MKSFGERHVIDFSIMLEVNNKVNYIIFVFPLKHLLNSLIASVALI